jgi:hypothetical protein
VQVPNLIRRHSIVKYSYPQGSFSPVPGIYLHPEKNLAGDIQNDNITKCWSINLLAVSMTHIKAFIHYSYVWFILKSLVFSSLFFSNGEIL